MHRPMVTPKAVMVLKLEQPGDESADWLSLLFAKLTAGAATVVVP
jgi:hypothetical protein